MSKSCCSDKPAYKFYYFNFRALGEAARLILNYAKVSFENIEVTHEQYDGENMKEKFQFGKLPVLELCCGKQLAESQAINRYLAKKYGLAGIDDWESAQIDSFADFHKDVLSATAPYLYTKLGGGTWYKAGDVAAMKPAFVEATKQFYPVYVRLLKESGSGFMAKSGLSWVDFVITEYLLTIKINEPEVLAEYQELEAYVQRVHAIPEIQEYLKSRPEYEI